jgi:O-antigen/teichoic acid export membrane protein
VRGEGAAGCHVIRKLLQSPFVRSVAVLTGGTAFAQALGVLALPLLTRLYTPDDFGVLGAFAAPLGIIAVVSALRFEIAIPLPNEDTKAAHLLAVSLISVIATTILTALVIAIWGNYLATAAFESIVGNRYLWLLPLGVFVTGAYSVFQNWAIRKKAYHRIARTRIEQAVGGIGSQVGLGWAGIGGLGLIIGQIISNGAGFIGLARRAWSDDKCAFLSLNTAALRQTAYEYRRFPKYSTFESLTNTAGLQLPLMLIAFYIGAAELGYLMLVMRILQAPMSLIGASIAQVYYGSAVDEHKNHQLMFFTVTTLKKLAAIGLPLLMVAVVVAPFVFTKIFGPAWARAGELVFWMAPFFFFQFLASPLSMVLHVMARQGFALALQTFGLIFRVFAVLAFSDFAAEAFAVSSALFYALYLGSIIILISRSEKQATASKVLQ